jgi:hypothetical protein
MHLYVEAWKARPAWLALPQADRERFFGIIGEEIGKQLGAGCELVGVALNDADAPRRANYHYVAVWKIPDQGHVQDFEETWERVGFHDYFEQINIRGELMEPDQFAGHMIGL